MRPTFVSDKPTTSILQVTPQVSMHPSYGVRYGIFHLNHHVGVRCSLGLEWKEEWELEEMEGAWFGIPTFTRQSLWWGQLRWEAPREVLTQSAEWAGHDALFIVSDLEAQEETDTEHGPACGSSQKEMNSQERNAVSLHLLRALPSTKGPSLGFASTLYWKCHSEHVFICTVFWC